MTDHTELAYLQREAYLDFQHEQKSWPMCPEGHKVDPDALTCEACQEWAEAMPVIWDVVSRAHKRLERERAQKGQVA